MNKKLIKYPLVSLEWKDAQSDAGWGDIRDIQEWAKKDFNIYEIGWLVEKNDKYVVITNQIAEDGDIGNRTKVPVGWIKKIKTVRINESRKRLKK